MPLPCSQWRPKDYVHCLPHSFSTIWDIICHWTLSCWFNYIDRSVSLQDALISGPWPHHSRVTDCGNAWGLEIPKFWFSFLNSTYCTQWPLFLLVAISDFVIVLFFIFLRDLEYVFHIGYISTNSREIYMVSILLCFVFNLVLNFSIAGGHSLR